MLSGKRIISSINDCRNTGKQHAKERLQNSISHYSKKLTRNGLKTNIRPEILKLQKKTRKVLLDIGTANKLSG